MRQVFTLTNLRHVRINLDIAFFVHSQLFVADIVANLLSILNRPLAHRTSSVTTGRLSARTCSFRKRNAYIFNPYRFRRPEPDPIRAHAQ